ncbi:hypothetical protein [Corynebacterium tuberculostearicum]|uniref:hypothetical protein n=1 Tax=Corynebacterium tuberculostearicum TaxID=38304 RepID=UPI0015C7D528|nr:hypothetical protein [Corynebacterium tuberculostearicum]NYI55898.1 hypothetical protein [Corynebacterium tuberculostearicum]QQU82154.1 hypothetical protein I6I74_01780 [Corynebacterium tuberculostearicum]
MTDQNPYSQQQEEPKKKKPWWKRWWVILIAVLILAGIGNAVTDGENNGADSDSGQPTAEQAPAEDKQEEESRQEEDPANEETPQQEEAQPKEEKKNTVSVAGQDWECQPVPDETMQRIMGGDKWDDGAHATVDKAVMVQGADNNFIAANITWEGEDDPFAADFTAPVDGSGPITSASPGTAELFNWPETPGGPFDGTDAAKECLAQ